MNPKEEIHHLTEEIKRHNYSYYVLASPTISDYEFDQLLTKLQKLETQYPEWKLPDSPTERVGGTITKDFPSFRHLHPMLSLGNSYSEADLDEFDKQIQKLAEGRPYSYLVEHKFDGVSLSLHYENGLLMRGVTRGDGQQGDEITANAKTIGSVPLRLRGNHFPDQLEVRGEVMMFQSDFGALNQAREAEGLAPLMNPRNTTAGTLKMQDSGQVAARPLQFFAYHLITNPLTVPSDYEQMDLLENWGFKLGKFHSHCPTIQAVHHYIQAWEERRKDLDYDIDGIVIKVNELDLREIMGNTAKAPRWAIAFKYKAVESYTQVESVDYQVGRTGKITPVANLIPVLLAGTTVKRASIHNADEIGRLDLHLEDTVSIEKGGDIIPKITGVVLEKRRTGAMAVQFPIHCPACSTKLIQPEGEVNHFCPNVSGCPPQIKGRISHFAGRKAMDIEGLGTEIVNTLVDQGLIQNYADLYELTYEQLIPLERFADQSVKNLLEGIEKSKSQPFARVLFGLGIRYVGATVAQKLAAASQNIQTLLAMSHEELVAIPDIGGRIAESIQEFSSGEENQILINQLLKAGLRLELGEEDASQPESDLLSGKIFVISGIFASQSRDELKVLIKKMGGKVSSSLSKKTSYLVAGENAGPSKMEKASQLEIPILSEEAFLKLLE
ncbi:MAG: NAD-dependent DNA ligase LigA [Bacteroidota bacterium]